LVGIIANLIINPNHITAFLKVIIFNHFYAVFTLPCFPVEKGGVEKFQLLSDKTGALFQAQSGLASSDDLLPSHLADFDSVNTNT
jgi:hypothetical protein